MDAMGTAKAAAQVEQKREIIIIDRCNLTVAWLNNDQQRRPG